MASEAGNVSTDHGGDTSGRRTINVHAHDAGARQATDPRSAYPTVRHREGALTSKARRADVSGCPSATSAHAWHPPAGGDRLPCKRQSARTQHPTADA